MRVHHLNCGSMRVPGAPLVCHVLLVETNSGLVLVDSGFGTRDCDYPGTRIGPFRHAIRPVLRRDETAIHQPSWRERIRYRRAQWAHGPTLVEHHPDGEAWRGFAAAKPLTELDDGIVLVSMPGHTRGHTAVAVDAGHRWVLHAGDAFYHPGTLDGHTRVPLALRAQDTLVCYDRRRLRANQARLAQVYRERDPGLTIVCAHDPDLYAHARDTA